MAQKSTLPAAIGLDVGSSRVRCVVGMQEEGAPAPSIIGVGVAETSGVRKGTVVDIEETVSAVTSAVDEAERISGVSVNHGSLGVNGNHLLAVASHGIIAIGSSAREITEQDIARVEEAATVMQLPPNREIIQAFPSNYTIDAQEHIKDPTGMSAMRLEVDTCLVTAGTPFLKNLARAVHQAGFSIDNYVSNPLAAANTLITKRDKELGTVVVDMGAATTGVAVFEEGELLHVAVIPVGSGHLTNDLAIGLRIDVEAAEKLKLEHVDTDPRGHNYDKEISVKELNGEHVKVSQTEVNRIAQARLDEVFDLVDKELKKIKREGMLPGGVLLCGGGAKLGHIDEYAKQAMRLPARVAKPEGFTGLTDKISDPAFATAIGLMLDNLHAAQHKEGALDSILGGSRRFVGGLFRRFRK